MLQSLLANKMQTDNFGALAVTEVAACGLSHLLA